MVHFTFIYRGEAQFFGGEVEHFGGEAPPSMKPLGRRLPLFKLSYDSYYVWPDNYLQNPRHTPVTPPDTMCTLILMPHMHGHEGVTLRIAL